LPSREIKEENQDPINEIKVSHLFLNHAKLGAVIVGPEGPRTRDVVQVARKCFDLTHSRGMATSDDIEEAFKDISI
jgi:hypothetical protein